MRRSTRYVWGLVLAMAVPVGSASAGIEVYRHENSWVEIGARIQIQYNNFNPDEGPATDNLFFRRLRPYIAGSITEDWMGKIQFDFGKALDADEVAVKDAYMRYSGWKPQSMKLYIGNTKSVFSRSFLTSSKYQQLVERPFVGNHELSIPDRQLGLRLDGKTGGTRVTWHATLGSEDHDPNAETIDFDSPVVRKEDWNQGRLVSARVDVHPLGEMKFSMGDFAKTDETRYTVGAGAYYWENDGDNNTYTDEDGVTTDPEKADLDQAHGVSVAGALRSHGFSVDGEYQFVHGETVDRNFTGGLYENGETDLDIWSIVGGYMVVNDKLEVVLAYQSLDASNYESAWTRKSIGVNYFFHRHFVKLQVTYRLVDNQLGVKGAGEDVLFGQMQFVF